MTLSRRQMMLGAASVPLAATLTRPALAQIALGQGRLTTVSDGVMTLPGSFLFDPVTDPALPDVLAGLGVSPDQVTNECNVTLYQDGRNTVLFDVGAGPDFVPSLGNLLQALEAAQVAPEDVTHVLFTHAHPDHIWGLLDDFDDLLFPEATYMMGRAEWDYWWDPETVNTIGEARTTFAVGAKRRMEAIADQVQFVEDGQEVLPGIAAVSSAGHTPGHMAYELRQGSEAALVVGDAIGNFHVAFARPGWPSGSDQDQDMGAATRQRLLDRVTADQMQVVGFHLPGGGIGRAEKTADGYRFISG